MLVSLYTNCVCSSCTKHNTKPPATEHRNTGQIVTFHILHEDSCCLDTWSEWMSQPTPGEFWLQFPRVIAEGQLDDPTPPGWPLWRMTYLCTTSPLRMISKWPWISRCGDYWQQAELRTDGACQIMMMMIYCMRSTLLCPQKSALSFSVNTSSVWNSLSYNSTCRSAKYVSTFRHPVKTELSNCAYSKREYVWYLSLCASDLFATYGAVQMWFYWLITAQQQHRQQMLTFLDKLLP